MSPLPLIKKGYADTSYGQIHYRYVLPLPETIKKQIPLLLLHKSASSSACYESLMIVFASQGYTCYAPDMPGFGSSFDPTPILITEITSLGTAWYTSVCISALETIGVFSTSSNANAAQGSKVHIIGHHSGAVLAVEMAATYPDLVASISLLGPTVMDASERAAMKEEYFQTFNEPVTDGSHLLKTWEYLAHMGVGSDLDLWQREAIDHIRAWKGRNLIYGAVWAQDAEKLYAAVQCPILLMCARDDVLIKYFGYVKSLRPDVRAVEVQGANFSPDRDVDGVGRHWKQFLEEIEK